MASRKRKSSSRGRSSGWSSRSKPVRSRGKRYSGGQRVTLVIRQEPPTAGMYAGDGAAVTEGSPPKRRRF